MRFNVAIENDLGFAGTIIILIYILITKCHGKFDALEPMVTGGTETFQIKGDKKDGFYFNTRRCTLEADTYKIRKVKKSDRDFRFYVIPGDLPELTDTDGNAVNDDQISQAIFESRMDRIAKAKCEIGWISLIEVKKRARNCGIATILTQLCMIDPFLTQNSDQNRVT